MTTGLAQTICTIKLLGIIYLLQPIFSHSAFSDHQRLKGKGKLEVGQIAGF